MPSRYLLLLLLATLLAACSQPVSPTPTPAATPLPAIVSEPGGPVRAAGKVIPAQEADLAFSTSGQVRTVPIAVGDTVKAGDLLVALDSTDADAGVVEAQAALFRAQANLDEMQAGPRTQEVTAAEARVQAAQARLDQLSTPASESENRCRSLLPGRRPGCPPAAFGRSTPGGAHRCPGRSLQCGGRAQTGPVRL